MCDCMINGHLDTKLDLSELDIISCFIASLNIDFKHPGYRSDFLINSRSDIAFQFNGKFIFNITILNFDLKSLLITILNTKNR